MVLEPNQWHGPAWAGLAGLDLLGDFLELGRVRIGPDWNGTRRSPGNPFNPVAAVRVVELQLRRSPGNPFNPFRAIRGRSWGSEQQRCGKFRKVEKGNWEQFALRKNACNGAALQGASLMAIRAIRAGDVGGLSLVRPFRWESVEARLYFCKLTYWRIVDTLAL